MNRRGILAALMILSLLVLACAKPQQQAEALEPTAAPTAEPTEAPATPAPTAAEPVSLTVPPTAEPTPEPTPVPTPEPTPSPVPTDTPTPSPTPTPTATPEPQAAFTEEFVLLEPGKKGTVTLNNSSLAAGTAVEIRLTDGTVVGSGKLRAGKNDLGVILPEGSPVLSEGKGGPHKIQGIGAGFVPDVLNTKVYDEVFKASNQAAFDTAKLLAHKEGILVGISSGAALYGAIELAKRPENKGKVIVALLPDSGDRYYSTALFSD